MFGAVLFKRCAVSVFGVLWEGARDFIDSDTGTDFVTAQKSQMHLCFQIHLGKQTK